MVVIFFIFKQTKRYCRSIMITIYILVYVTKYWDLSMNSSYGVFSLRFHLTKFHCIACVHVILDHIFYTSQLVGIYIHIYIYILIKFIKENTGQSSVIEVLILTGYISQTFVRFHARQSQSRVLLINYISNF